MEVVFFSKIASMMLVVDNDEVDGATMAMDLDFSIEEEEEKLVESI